MYSHRHLDNMSEHNFIGSHWPKAVPGHPCYITIHHTAAQRLCQTSPQHQDRKAQRPCTRSSEWKAIVLDPARHGSNSEVKTPSTDTNANEMCG